METNLKNGSSNDVFFREEYFSCVCLSDEHTLRFAVDLETGEVYTSVFLGYSDNIFQRIWNAVKYIFGYRCKYGFFDCFILQDKDYRRFGRMVAFAHNRRRFYLKKQIQKKLKKSEQQSSKELT